MVLVMLMFMVMQVWCVTVSDFYLIWFSFFCRLRKLFAQKMEDGKEFNDLIILYCSSGRWERLRLTQAWLLWGR